MSDRRIIITIVAGLAIGALGVAAGLAFQHEDYDQFLAFSGTALGILAPSPLSKTTTDPGVDTRAS